MLSPTTCTSSSSSPSGRPARRTRSCPNYVTETGYTEDIQGRTNVGDTQDRRLLAVLNLKTGKTAWADGSFAPPVERAAPPPARPTPRTRRRRPAAAQPHRTHAAGKRSARSAGRCPTSPTTASWPSRRAFGRQQGSLARHDRSRDRQDARRRHAARRRVDSRSGAGFGVAGVEFLPRQHSASGSSRSATAGCTSTRWMPAMPSAQAEAADLRQVGDHAARSSSRDGSEVLHHDAPKSIRASGTCTRCRSTAARGRRSRR